MSSNTTTKQTSDSRTTTSNTDLTDYYHSLEAADGIRSVDLTLQFETISTGPRDKNTGVYYRVTNDTPELAHDWAFLSFNSVFKHVRNSDVHWPTDTFQQLHNTRITATDLSIGTHAGGMTIHTDVLPEPIRIRTDNWSPDNARTQQRSRAVNDHSDTQVFTNTAKQSHIDRISTIERDIALGNHLTITNQDWLTGTITRPVNTTQSKTTYPVEISTGTDTFEIPFTISLPAKTSTRTRGETPFETLIDTVGGSPEYIPGTDVAIIPATRSNTDTTITTTGTGTQPGRWALTTPELIQSQTKPLYKRLINAVKP